MQTSQHLISDKKKDADWLKARSRYYLDQSLRYGKEKADMQTLRDAAEGIIDEDTYTYVLNPFNTNNDQLKRFPSKLRNYGIIRPILEAFLGEHGVKNRRPTVVAKPNNADSEMKQKKMDFMAKYIAQDFVNNLNETGINTGIPSVSIPGYDELNKKFDLNYDDFRAKIGQKALDYVRDNVSFEDKEMLMLYDWLTIGRYATYKDVHHDDVTFEVLDCIDLDVFGWGATPYIEDAEAVKYTRWISPTHLLEMLHDEIHESDDKTDILELIAKRMDSVTSGLYNSVAGYRNERLNSEISYIDYARYMRNADSGLTDRIRLDHVCFKTLKEVYTLTYTDETGATQVMDVDANYKLDKSKGDIKLLKHVIPEVWEEYIIEDKWHLGGGVLPVQRHKVNNTASCKLPYNGRILGYRNREITSVTKTGLVYEALHNIFMYRFEMSVAKAKDKLLLFPLGLIPDGPDWDEDKWMYRAHASGIAFYDEQADKAMAAISAIKEINLGLSEHLYKMWEFTNGIKDKWWESIGFNRQRFGDTYASDGKGSNEQALIRSSIISADMTRQFDRGVENESQGILDYAKVAFSQGKKGTYVLPDGTQEFLNMTMEDAMQFLETDFGIFAKNTNEELEKLNQVKNSAIQMNQNGLPSDAVTELILATNIAEVKEIVKEGVRNEREFQEKLQKQQQDAAMQVAQQQEQTAQANRNVDIEVANIQAKAKVRAAEIAADMNAAQLYNDTMDSMNADDNMIEDADYTKRDKQRLDNDKADFNRQVHNDNVRLKEQDQNIKLKGMDNAMKIAKTNKN